uniref:Solute carrier family 40 member n=1 Tax=Acrobeloides nanus TaxID=290746 RepID=A0A914D0T2_9BILA
MIAIAFFMTYFGGMLLVVISQFFGNILSMFLISYLGNWLDRKDRKDGILSVLAVNNWGVAISCGIMAICCILPSEATNLRMSLLILALISHSISRLAATCERIGLTKDWAVVLVKREQNTSLSEINSTLTIIDQLSFVISPLIVSFMLKYLGYFISAFIIVGWNLFAWIVSRYLLVAIYDEIPELTKRAIKGINMTKISS